MNYGLYLSASGVLTNLYRQDVFANNLANTKTAAYKPDVAVLSQRQPESIEDGFGLDVSNDLLDKLGGGVFAGPQWVNFNQGSLEKTGNPTDVALEQKDQFFAIGQVDDASQQQVVRLTRDGRFTASSQGFLVMMTGGQKVLDTNDRAIELGNGPVQIDSTGQVIQNNEVIAQLQITSVSDTQQLRKLGSNLFAMPGQSNLRQTVEKPAIRPGYIETSGTDPIQALMKMLSATKSVSGNASMIRYHDQMMDQAVNTLGRVVA